MIPVTKPFLPPRAEYEHYLTGIWARNWLTNAGPLVTELEAKLTAHLGLQHLLYTTNGTLALQLAIKALGLKGEVITTPFSYVATCSSIVWEGCTPVFADIDPLTLNLDPNRIEDAITPHTSAILATHVYGNPCDTEAIAAIARQYNLKVIYDAAHTFGTLYRGRSLYAFGDVSTASFHATKLFHTVEGGACMTADPELAQRIAYLRNFGHDGPERFNGVGINGKNSEFHAAMGLAVLPHMPQILEKRRQQWERYRQLLDGLPLEWPGILAGTISNRAYVAVLFPTEKLAVQVRDGLEALGIGTRRYFYPALTTLDYTHSLAQPCLVAAGVASRVLCLPVYHDLNAAEVERIADEIKKALTNG